MPNLECQSCENLFWGVDKLLDLSLIYLFGTSCLGATLPFQSHLQFSHWPTLRSVTPSNMYCITVNFDRAQHNNFYYIPISGQTLGLYLIQNIFYAPTVLSSDKLIFDWYCHYRSDNYIIILRYLGQGNKTGLFKHPP